MSNHSLLQIPLSTFFHTLVVLVQYPLRMLRYPADWCDLLRTSGTVMDTSGFTTCNKVRGSPTYLDNSHLSGNWATKNLGPNPGLLDEKLASKSAV